MAAPPVVKEEASAKKKNLAAKISESINKEFLNTFAVMIICFIFIYVFAVTFIPIPKDNIRFADSALTFLLATAFFTIITWGFRSSKAQIDKESAEREIKLINGSD